MTSRWLLTNGAITDTPVRQCQAPLPREAAAAFSQLPVPGARARALRGLPPPRTHTCQVPAAPLQRSCPPLRGLRGDLGATSSGLPNSASLHPLPSSPFPPRQRECQQQRCPPACKAVPPPRRPGLPAPPLTQDARHPQGQLLQVRLAGARGLGRGGGRRLLHGSRARSARRPGSRGAGAGERGAPQGRAPPPRLGHRVHGMPGVVVLGAEAAAAAAMGGPGCSAKRRSAGRSCPRPRLELPSDPPGLGDDGASARTLPARRGRPRRSGRASAPSGQWERRLASGAGRPRPDAPSGGCFKMADAARPSRPGAGAAAFWSRDCILSPPGRGRRRRRPGAGTRPGTVRVGLGGGRGRGAAAAFTHPGGGAVRSGRPASRLAGGFDGIAPARSGGQAGVPGVGLSPGVPRPCAAVSSGMLARGWGHSPR